jgi:hypothetical protein
MAESLMVDTCTIRRVTGVTTNPLTGVDTPTLAVVYTGRCKVQALDPQEHTPDVSGHTYTIQRYRVDVPVAAYKPAPGDLVTMDTATLDVYLVGRVLRVVALLHKSLATAYRLSATDDAGQVTP